MTHKGWSVATCLIAVAWLAELGRAQTPAPPNAKLIQRASDMAIETRKLAQGIQNELGQTPEGKQLHQDAAELVLAIEEFRDAAGATTDRFTLRRQFSGIDTSWWQLQTQLKRPGTPPSLTQGAAPVGRLDAEIGQMLGLNAMPAAGYRNGPPATQTAVTQRLAHALADRAEALAAVVRADMVGPRTAGVLQDAINLAQEADNYHDGLDLSADPKLAQNGFAGVSVVTNKLAQDFALIPPPPRVVEAWKTYKSAEVLLRQRVGLANRPEDLEGTALAPSYKPAVTTLADQLVQQVTAFVQVFGPTAGAVPEGAWFLADAQRLQTAATNFRTDAASGVDPARLAFEFQDVDALWQRLARRTNRIGRGRTGPNIQQVGVMGQTIGDIHRMLAMPGYPPVINAPAPVPAPVPSPAPTPAPPLPNPR